jgi:hypothetical protein
MFLPTNGTLEKLNLERRNERAAHNDGLRLKPLGPHDAF